MDQQKSAGKSHGVHAICTDQQLDSLISSGVRMAVNCWAPWAAPCHQMNAVFDTLQQQHATRVADVVVDELVSLVFASMQPEKLPAAMKRFNIGTVPTFLLFANRRLVRRSSGADAALLADNLGWLAQSSDAALLNGACDVVSSLDEITVVMKGTADEPKCAFSRQAVQVLRSAGVHFATFNVLEDEQVRSAMKERFEWATFPMLFCRGKLVGGIDLMRDLADEGKLVEHLSGGERGEGAQEEEGVGSAAKSGSADGEAALEKKSVEVNGDVGRDGGEHESQEQQQGKKEEEGMRTEVRERLTRLVSGSEVMLFMKGSPTAPRCGFSRRIVEILREEAVQYEHFDILTDNEVRQGLKKMWEWPTYPQLYAHGKLVGGLDIVKELVQCGELKRELAG
ncbi:unnamed protein product [Agarophyton chilense]|eukprot:gb/GEZJ01002655.1/.p1 GENE.gb/GEZJ01002655.1/~~gb/GEZJ01002655.1/.p1  ORF type:complete len:396 (-),score=50.37 gb/GEZJ01002655.1/:909-2096(-)